MREQKAAERSEGLTGRGRTPPGDNQALSGPSLLHVAPRRQLSTLPPPPGLAAWTISCPGGWRAKARFASGDPASTREPWQNFQDAAAGPGESRTHPQSTLPTRHIELQTQGPELGNLVTL